MDNINTYIFLGWYVQEMRIAHLAALLDTQRAQAIANVERKQARTADELEVRGCIMFF